MYGEAMRVASKHAPHLMSRLNEEGGSGQQMQGQSAEDILNSAKIYESQKNYNKAIDRYLEITEQHFNDAERLADIWNNAFNLSMAYAKDRV